MKRGRLAALALVLLVAMAGCVSTADPTASLYHHGELVIGTGNTTGVFYQIGAGYANVVSRHLPGYEAISAATAGSVDNLHRLASGDVDVALVFASNAADALNGSGAFKGKPEQVRAIARLYPSYTHLVVRRDADINSVYDLRGHEITTGPRGSGSEATALRVLAAAGLVPDQDVTNTPMSLTESTAALIDGRIDAMFYTAGLPVPGIDDLFNQHAAEVELLPLDPVLGEMNKMYGSGVYTRGTIPGKEYGLPAGVPTIVESNLLVVESSMPDDLVYQLTKLLFEYLPELAKVHPAANSIERTTAQETEPVPLHPGAKRYYAGK